MFKEIGLNRTNRYVIYEKKSDTFNNVFNIWKITKEIQISKEEEQIIKESAHSVLLDDKIWNLTLNQNHKAIYSKIKDDEVNLKIFFKK